MLSLTKVCSEFTRRGGRMEPQGCERHRCVKSRGRNERERV